MEAKQGRNLCSWPGTNALFQRDEWLAIKDVTGDSVLQANG